MQEGGAETGQLAAARNIVHGARAINKGMRANERECWQLGACKVPIHAGWCARRKHSKRHGVCMSRQALCASATVTPSDSRRSGTLQHTCAMPGAACA